jgi:23S rRNA (cytosine1962-C5)-methyltransferase
LDITPDINLLASPNWTDYELLDCGDGQKLERFGDYTFVRPEVQALWSKALSPTIWQAAHAVFNPSGEESGGHWTFQKKIPERWEMSYALSPNTSIASHYLQKGTSFLGKEALNLKFSVMTTPGRHLGVFPECASNWEWMSTLIRHRVLGDHLESKKASVSRPRLKNSSLNQGKEVNVLSLFGYTGLASLTCAASGARVTHLDASKKSVNWARNNQILSNLNMKPVRWIVDDALKFVEREIRRGVKYDGIVLDPPKFGRGPKGEVWEVFQSLPELLHLCRAVLSDSPLFIVLTLYAVKISAIHAYAALEETMKGAEGELECGELIINEKSARRLLSQSVYARWKSQEVNLDYPKEIR